MFPLHYNRLNRKFWLNGKRSCSAPRVEKGSDNHDNDDDDDEDDDDDDDADADADDDDYDSYVLLTIAEK